MPGYRPQIIRPWLGGLSSIFNLSRTTADRRRMINLRDIINLATHFVPRLVGSAKLAFAGKAARGTGQVVWPR
jgi:hypothetical protein